MIRLFALGSYAYQSLTAIILIFAVSHILAPAGYTAFSFALASSQLLCVLMFEWLQLAGIRFLSAAQGEDAARLRASLLAGAAFSATALIMVGGCASLFGTLPRNVVMLGLALAILQGLTDLHFMMIRVSGKLGVAAVLFIVRASVILIGAVSGAFFLGSAEATLLGILSGYVTGLLAGWFTDAAPLRLRRSRRVLADLADFCRYGMLAAGASGLHLSVPMLLRFILVGRLGEGGATVSAGISMALDLLQRPYAVLVSAIHTVNYPEAVFQFEHGSEHDARQATARLFEFVICTTVIMLAGLVAFLPDAARLFVPHDIVAGFLAAAPATTLFYFLHTHLQATLAVVPHLRKSALRLTIVAALQLLAVSIAAIVMVNMRMPYPMTIGAAALATALVTILASGPTLGFGARPRPSLVIVACAAAALIGSTAMLPSDPLPWLAGKVLISIIGIAAVAWQGDFLLMKKRDPTTQL